MKALILNSGIGKRMGIHTRNKPKCLIEIKPGNTILSHQIDILAQFNITEYIVTTGPFPGLIEEYCRNKYPAFSFIFINNPEYASTNAIYSFYLASSAVHDDLIFLHGDLIFNKNVCNMIISNKNGNCTIVKTSAPLPEKDFKARIKNGIIDEISVSLFDEDCVFQLPFYKLTSKAYLLWIEETKRWIESGNKNVYAENAFNKISTEIRLKPIDILTGFCMEIDTPEDLRLAKRNIQ